MKKTTALLATLAFAVACSDNKTETVKVEVPAQSEMATQAIAAWNVDAGTAVAAWCNSCHGPNGNSDTRYVPHLSGQRLAYVVEGMTAYKDGSRDNPTMRAVVNALTNEALADVAAYYSDKTEDGKISLVDEALDIDKANAKLSPPLVQWVPSCERCHSESQYGDPGSLPILAGQREEYLAYALHAYQNKFLRDSTMMHAMTELLTRQDIKDISTYYAEQHPSEEPTNPE